MRRGVQAVITMILLWMVAAGASTGRAVNEYIQISARVERDSLKAGSQGRLLFTLKPRDGFHVNVEPPISLELADTKDFILLSKKFTPDSTTKPLTTKDGYKILNASAPVRFDFKIGKSLKPGRHTVHARLTYYYCSDAEGWCSFTTETIPVTMTILPAR